MQSPNTPFHSSKRSHPKLHKNLKARHLGCSKTEHVANLLVSKKTNNKGRDPVTNQEVTHSLWWVEGVRGYSMKLGWSATSDGCVDAWIGHGMAWLGSSPFLWYGWCNAHVVEAMVREAMDEDGYGGGPQQVHYIVHMWLYVSAQTWYWFELCCTI